MGVSKSILVVHRHSHANVSGDLTDRRLCSDSFFLANIFLHKSQQRRGVCDREKREELVCLGCKERAHRKTHEHAIQRAREQLQLGGQVFAPEQPPDMTESLPEKEKE